MFSRACAYRWHSIIRIKFGPSSGPKFVESMLLTFIGLLYQWWCYNDIQYVITALVSNTLTVTHLFWINDIESTQANQGMSMIDIYYVAIFKKKDPHAKGQYSVSYTVSTVSII